jgi:AcrR family transcriptional regulator
MTRPGASPQRAGFEPARPAGGRYALHELLGRACVGASTVHLYRRLGLLPAPVSGPGHRFVYDDRHLRALRTIRRLRERNHLSLATIGRLLPTLLEERVDELDDERWEPVVASALHRFEPARPPRRLVTAARDAFARRGYDAVSVEEISAGAGLSKGSFYRYFASKDAAFLAAARSIVDVINDALGDRAGTVDAEDVIDELGALIDPLVPLFLEVVVRALHGQSDHAEVVAEIIAGVGAGAARRAGVPPDAVDERAAQIAEAALARLLRARFELATER